MSRGRHSACSTFLPYCVRVEHLPRRVVIEDSTQAPEGESPPVTRKLHPLWLDQRGVNIRESNVLLYPTVTTIHQHDYHRGNNRTRLTIFRSKRDEYIAFRCYVSVMKGRMITEFHSFRSVLSCARCNERWKVELDPDCISICSRFKTQCRYMYARGISETASRSSPIGSSAPYTDGLVSDDK